MPQPSEDTHMASSEVYRFSVKRIKKKINDFILNNYSELTPVKDADTSEESPNRDMAMLPAEFQTKLLTPEDFIRNPKIH